MHVFAGFGALMFITGLVSWAFYRLGRVLGAPSISSFMHNDRWRIASDLTGDGLLTMGDIWIWAGSLAYGPGDLVITIAMYSPIIRHFLELSPAAFGGPVSATVSFSFWFGLPSLLIAAAVGTEEN